MAQRFEYHHRAPKAGDKGPKLKREQRRGLPRSFPNGIQIYELDLDQKNAKKRYRTAVFNGQIVGEWIYFDSSHGGYRRQWVVDHSDMFDDEALWMQAIGDLDPAAL